MNSLLALLAKAGTMAISLVCGILTTRLILGEAGVEHYALFSLLTVLPSMLAFTDLGAGAVIVNGVATSDDPRADDRLVAQLTSVGRILVAFSIGLMLLNALMLASGGWALVLGESGALPRAALAAFLCLTVFCLGVPVGIWVRIMLGLRRNHVVILLQGLISPLTLLGVFLLTRLPDAEGHAFLAIASYGASFVVSAIGLALTWRGTTPLIPRAAAALPRLRREQGVRVMDVGWPMLAQLISYPIAVSTQRYVLAQSGDAAQVAEYGVVAQLFLALNGLMLAAGVALWPAYARKRHRGELRRGPAPMAWLFGGSVAAATLLVWLLEDPIFAFITGGEVDVTGSTVLAFGAMITCIAGVYPLGMFLMDKPAIRFQVVPTLAMAIASLALSIILAPTMGAAGPPLGNALAVLVCQIVPFSIYIRRNRERLMAPQQG
ncbi:oligosaccharide flippase family protein [Agrococcus sp. Marseille-Q4369]|uniref:lipopolysaccharide biosynthesis protein n=1 Tax=Agrococcus sp. Marseille-Q4369 TaxID=2810513 RepID=UPI001B8C8026|nr:oligosaccharide flippase family protein [Agrococcus sp. Marseille-Q4369]QUW18945.1 oligosaccharide flippase family protein [Agrococcus sp. Marseille-Q4369]